MNELPNHHTPSVDSLPGEDPHSRMLIDEESVLNNLDARDIIRYPLQGLRDGLDHAIHIDQPSPMGTLSYQRPFPMNPNARDTNWLPFDQFNLDTFSPETMDERLQQSVAELEPLTMRPSEQGVLNSPGYPFVNDISTSRNNAVSALITSMRVGFSEKPDSRRETGQSKGLGRNKLISLYADGAGARTSQSDRRIIERQELHATRGEHGDSSQDLLPPWVAILQAKVRRASESDPSHMIIPDNVFEEALSKLCPPWSVFPVSIQHSPHKDILLRKETLEFFMELYFEHFHPVNPFLDRSLLCIPVWGWSLCLAASALGVRFLCISELTAFGDRLCSVLHSILHEEVCLPSNAFAYVNEGHPSSSNLALSKTLCPTSKHAY